MAPRVSHKKVAVKLALPFHQEGVMLHAVKVVLHAGAPKVAVKIQSYDGEAWPRPGGHLTHGDLWNPHQGFSLWLVLQTRLLH